MAVRLYSSLKLELLHKQEIQNDHFYKNKRNISLKSNFHSSKKTMVRPYLFSFLKSENKFFSKYRKSFFLTFRTSLALASLLFLSACTCAGGGGIGGETNPLSSLTLEINAAKYNVNFDDNRNARISARMSRLAPHTLPSSAT